MKIKLLLCWGITSLLIGCTAKPDFTISFCESQNAQDQCAEEKSQFPVDQQIYVRFGFGENFEGKQINGKICRITESDTVVLGNKQFDLKPEDSYIIQDLPFHEFGMGGVGNFVIRFEDEHEHILAEKNIHITSS